MKNCGVSEAETPRYRPTSQGPVVTANEARDPSPVTLRLMKAPEPDTLSPRERAWSFYIFHASAATMICLGASEIHMSPTSELGPIDPQIEVRDQGAKKYLAAHEVIESYNELMNKANRTRGRVEPFLQQLNRFDARDIRRIKSAQALSESIAIRCLRSGPFPRMSERRIRSKMVPFLNPQFTKVHGRPIYQDVAHNCGLNVRLHGLKSEFWQVVWRLYVRLNYVVTHQYSKIIESAEHSWTAPLVLPDAPN